MIVLPGLSGHGHGNHHHAMVAVGTAGALAIGLAIVSRPKLAAAVDFKGAMAWMDVDKLRTALASALMPTERVDASGVEAVGVDGQLTSDGVDLVKRTWSVAEAADPDMGMRLFRKIFEMAPDALQLWPLEGENASESKAMRKHALKVIKTIGTMVNMLGIDRATFADCLQTVGKRHAGYKVEQRHLKVAAQAMEVVLCELLGPDFLPPVQAAWRRVMEMVVDEMCAGLASAAPTVDEFGNLTEAGIKELQRTYAVVEKMSGEVGVMLYMKIFKMAPHVLKLFPFRDDADLAHSPRLRAHAMMVIRTIGATVSLVAGSDMDVREEVLRGLGKRHGGYGVTVDHFPVLGNALIWTLENVLASDWTPRASQAWTSLYLLVQREMGEGMKVAPTSDEMSLAQGLMSC